MKISKLKSIAAICIGFLIFLFVYWNMVEANLAKSYGKLQLGDSVQKLIDLAGDPNYETDGTKWVEPQHTKSENELIEGCKRELWYKVKYNPMPEKWSYCFDVNEKLIHKEHWVSW